MKDATSSRGAWAAAGVAVVLLFLHADASGPAGNSIAPKTGFGFAEACLAHDTADRHVERPARIVAVRDRLRTCGLPAEMAECPVRDDSARWAATVHTAAYVRRVQDSCRGGKRTLDSPDTYICRRSYEAALAAVGVVLGAVDAVAGGECRNAFCAVRPPGHHAKTDRAAGFCIFNSVAVAVRYAQKAHGLEKVLIVDWDLHHGDGTQAIFCGDPTVLYFSVHEFPAYPGTGGPGEHASPTAINCPLPPGSGDEDYLHAFREILVPAADTFEPDIVFISAGFDAHEDDPLGHMNVTADGFAEMTRIVKGIAARHCDGRLVSVLEGGYDLQALGDCAEAHVRALMD